MPRAHLHAGTCASIPGHTASSPREIKPLTLSEIDGVAQGRRQELRRFGRYRPQGRRREFRARRLQSIPRHPSSLTHPNSTSTDKGAAMLRKPRSQETPLSFRYSRPTSVRRGRKRRCSGRYPPQLLEEGRRDGHGHCWGLWNCCFSAL